MLSCGAQCCSMWACHCVHPGSALSILCCLYSLSTMSLSSVSDTQGVAMLLSESLSGQFVERSSLILRISSTCDCSLLWSPCDPIVAHFVLISYSAGAAGAGRSDSIPEGCAPVELPASALPVDCVFGRRC